MKKHDVIEILKKFDIQEIFFDSRKVTKNSVFFCIQYTQNYIDEALEKGAKFVVCSADIYDDRILIVDDVRESLAEAAAYLYPKRPQYIAAVTGTSGKTSTADYFRQLGTSLGLKIASMGTMGIICSDKDLEKKMAQYSILDTGLNTPDILTMRKVLNMLALHGVTHLILEASSHGLDQKRMFGVPVSVAGFTSFAQDHLDYHHTMEAYKFAKLKLFSENLIDGGKAIISSDVLDNDLMNLSATNPSNHGHGIYINTVGKNGDVEIASSFSSMTEHKFSFKHHNKHYEINTSIIGKFQSSNIVIASLMLEACDINFDDIVPYINNLKPVPGRLERVTSLKHPWQIFVDYAHKPNAFESVFAELKNICKGRFIVVFGCGGDRDRLKRTIMGKIAQDIADIIIVTDDNPRTENPNIIRKEIMVSCHSATEVPNRAEAIKYAVNLMKKDDILLLAGKGHENYQIVGDQHIHFSDVEEARKYI